MNKENSISERVIVSALEVSNRLGVGFLESVYENALCVELDNRGIAFHQQKPIKVIYKGQVVGRFVADMVIEDKLLLELKAMSGLAKNHTAQVINYLKATGISVGLLLNFGTPKLGVQRIVHQYNELEVI